MTCSLFVAPMHVFHAEHLAILTRPSASIRIMRGTSHQFVSKTKNNSASHKRYAENWHVYSVDLETDIVRDLTPFQGIRSDVMFTSKSDPDSILVGLNLSTRSSFDMYRWVC